MALERESSAAEMDRFSTGKSHDASVDTLQTMKIFVRVAQRSGFAAAARDLRMSAAAVTKHVAALETRIGTRLFDRTTRSVGLTEAGRVYLERCMECLQAFEDADASVSELSTEPTGLLRVTAPIDLQRHADQAERDDADQRRRRAPQRSRRGPRHHVLPELRARRRARGGRLELLLPDWTVVPSLRLYAIYPHRRFLSPKVRAFVEALRDEFGDGTREPWWPPANDMTR